MNIFRGILSYALNFQCHKFAQTFLLFYVQMVKTVNWEYCMILISSRKLLVHSAMVFFSPFDFYGVIQLQHIWNKLCPFEGFGTLYRCKEATKTADTLFKYEIQAIIV